MQASLKLRFLKPALACLFATTLGTSCSSAEMNGASSSAKKKEPAEAQEEDKEESSAPIDEDEQTDTGLEQSGHQDDAKDDALDEDDEEVAAADQCEKPGKGDPKTSMTVTGEDFPNNGIDPGAGDNNDYRLEISGSFYAKHPELGVKDATTLSVSYHRVDSQCGHSFRFSYRKCPNADSKVVDSATLNAAGGQNGLTATLEMPKDTYLGIVLTSDCAIYNLGSTTVNLLDGSGQFFEFK